MRTAAGDRPVIVDVRRSPVGRAHKGSLADVRPDDLAARMVRALLEANPAVDPATIDDLVCGCAFPWGEQGYNVGRNIAILAGLPHHVPAQTVTRLCGSSLQALRTAAHAIMAGEGDTFVVSGVESVSRVGHGHHLATKNPLLDPEADGDTLGAVFMPMGLTAENVADRWGVTRERMDAFAQRSQERAVAAREAGITGREIVPVELPSGQAMTEDDCPRASSTLEKLASLDPVFRSDGRVTAGNSCPLNDGAAAALVMGERRAAALGLTPRARVLASAVSAVDPALMGVGPIEAVKQALGLAGVTIDDVDVFELNEAFAAQVIPVCEEVGIDPFDDRVNPFGGAIAIGHPFGMTGLRIMSSLLNGLDETGGTIGVECMCIGGGQGQAMVVERLS
ncbi:acetyl-CoA C-acyltransferase [Paraconexibacter antarcticus]|uniref:Acetyl-CoA C-acyltransferase n=1 Tax=Paraconexibacter antarcticus TaxID=2949664 RepID=A0ABY5DQ23_9ACTN|nr:acetyl-CoA C-acyltransferase [Paraconexibacter antarcticus]UTI62986.1 acetyl-CoA C-acyltransferase [Paraconexibacter antarcticus]